MALALAMVNSFGHRFGGGCHCGCGSGCLGGFAIEISFSCKCRCFRKHLHGRDLLKNTYFIFV